MTVFVLVMTHLHSLAAFANGSPNFSNSETNLPLLVAAVVVVVVVVVVFAGERRGAAGRLSSHAGEWKKKDVEERGLQV